MEKPHHCPRHKITYFCLDGEALSQHAAFKLALTMYHLTWIFPDSDACLALPAVDDTVGCLPRPRWDLPVVSAIAPHPPHTSVFSRYRSEALGDNALGTNQTVPTDHSYVFVQMEEYCSSVALPGATPLTLWVVPGNHLTCGTAECEADAKKSGFKAATAAPLCYAIPTTIASTVPCRFALPSIARNDTAFFDNNYWRGRIWQQQQFLTWADLARYRSHPATIEPRVAIADKASKLFQRQYRLFGQVGGT